MDEYRRLFLLSALTGLAGTASTAFAPALACAALPVRTASEALRTVVTAQPSLNYHAVGPDDGRPIIFARDHTRSIADYAEIASLLAAQAFHVLLPTLRDADPAALGHDLIAFLDSLHMPEAVFVGIGKGAHAARDAARLRPTRIVGLVLAEDGQGTTASREPVAARTVILASTTQALQIADAAAMLARQGKWRT